jgi:recombination protein RecA
MAVKKTEGPVPSRRNIIEERLRALGVEKSIIKSTYRIGDDFDTPVEFVSTGQVEVDGVLGEGSGIPRGTLIEFCGASGSGKTYLAMKHCAEHQKLGGRAAYIDIENTFFRPRAEALGVDLSEDKFELYANLGYGELYGDLAVELAESGEYTVIVLDSIKAMNSKDETDKSQQDVMKLATHAVMIKRMLIKLMPACSKTNTTVILINQFYSNVPKPGGFPSTQDLAAAGGKAMEYFTHMRLWINKINGKAGHIMDVVDGEPTRVGGKSKLEVYKTRYGTPGVTEEFPIMFGAQEGNPVAEFIYRASARGKDFIERTGRGAKRTYKFIDKSTGDTAGEVLAEAVDEYDFVQDLLTCAAPSKLTRGDTSVTGFEYICGRLRIGEPERDRIVAKLSNRTAVASIDEELEA